MTLSNLLPSIKELSLIDKLRLIGILAEEVQPPIQEVEQVVPLFQPNQLYYLHTPYDTFGAADILMQVLEQEKTQN